MVKVSDLISNINLLEKTKNIGINSVNLLEESKNKTIILFAVLGAFTPTCSEKHLPGFVENFQKFKDKNINEIFCVSVNDVFVMSAWGESLNVAGKVRMLADGSGLFTKDLDLTDKGLGLRSLRYSMLIKAGKVLILNIENGGDYKVSDALTLLNQI